MRFSVVCALFALLHVLMCSLAGRGRFQGTLFCACRSSQVPVNGFFCG